jgi:hypothetical protein
MKYVKWKILQIIFQKYHVQTSKNVFRRLTSQIEGHDS